MDIAIRALTVRYGDTVAVRDLDVDIADGELLVLLGPSGCGKTTTMRCIVGLETAGEGTIEIGDRVVFDAAKGVNVPANKRNVGMVFQSYAIWPHMTVAENVSFPLRMQKVRKPEIRERVAEALATVGLEGFGDRGASLLSGGQMQRVALARSLVMRPSMLLLDEPLSNLDAKLREKLRFELREIQQTLGITTVYVTHDQHEALALADRIAVMRDGVIVQLGTPTELYREPNSVFVADFLGVDNILPGTVDASDQDGTTVRVGEHRVVAPPGDHATGSQVHVCVRPEDVTLTADGTEGAGGTSNTLPATVLSSSFLGDQTRYHIALADGQDMYATSTDKRTQFAPETRILARVAPDQVQLLVD
ncbi:MAG: ATP-binding cassette domain-containing protein [Streptosporangiales bacterium]|nr:ATP-binding cassette domain-containing protein [Streptosporangiales bacterium]